MYVQNPRASGGEKDEKKRAQLFREDQEAERGLLARWHRLTAPPPVGASAPLEAREIVRRGRLASTILLIMLILVVAALPVEYLQNPRSVPLVVIVLVVVCASLWFNRRGLVNIAGSLIVGMLGLAYTLLLGVFQPHGLISTGSVALYDGMIETELLAVSLLPPRSVFIVGLYNSIFVILNFRLVPHTADLRAFEASIGPDIIVRPIALYLIVAVVTYLWVRSATGAIKRADRAEEISKLQHDLAQQSQVIVEQKRLLDVSIQQIIETHMRVANGDLNARVPLTQNNTLWQIAGTLNNLLARFQHACQAEQKVTALQTRLRRAHQIEYELTRTTKEIEKYLKTLRKAEPDQKSAYGAATDVVSPVVESMEALLSHLLQTSQLMVEPTQQRKQPNMSPSQTGPKGYYRNHLVPQGNRDGFR